MIKLKNHALNAFEYFIEHLPQFKIQVSSNVITLVAPNLKSYDVFVIFDGVFTSFKWLLRLVLQASMQPLAARHYPTQEGVAGC